MTRSHLLPSSTPKKNSKPKRASKTSARGGSRPETEARSQFVSHFTPGLMSPRVLEKIFVGRTALAERLMGVVRSSATTNAKQHTLLVAPRGFGKSHLVALVYHRIQADQELAKRLRVAWLREEEWGITSFLDLLLRIYRALSEQYPGEIPASEWNTIYELSEAGAQDKAVRLLREFVGERTLLVLLENADDVFAGLGDSGQKRWRAFLQENNFCSTLLTSPSLFNGVSRRESPFFGFFRVIHLEPLSLDEAVELLHRLATLSGDEELADFLRSSVGRARVRAIHHLAGGNPRVYVIFAQFLTRQSLDELVEPFFKMLDELTPYYQSRMQLISPQQRKIIEFLCDYRGAAPVKMVASRGFMSQQTASGQLLDLKDKGYVVPKSIGRETFYELREPLMRLCIEVKKNRGEPIGLLVDFLRLWYPLEQLQLELKQLDTAHPTERIYLQHAIRLAKEETDPRIEACHADADRFYKAGNYAATIQACSDLLALHPPQLMRTYVHMLCAVCFVSLGRLDDAASSASQAIELDVTLPEAWELRARIWAMQDQIESSLSDWNQAVALSSKPAYLLERSSTLVWLGRKEEATSDAGTALHLYAKEGVKESRLEPRGSLWLKAASLLCNSGQIEEAKTALHLATRSKVEDWNFYNQLSWLWQRLEEPKNALQAMQKSIELNPSEIGLRFAKAMLEVRKNSYAAARRTLNLAEEFLVQSDDSEENLASLTKFRVANELSAGKVGNSFRVLEQSPLHVEPEQADWDSEDRLRASTLRDFLLRRELLVLMWQYVPVDRWEIVCPRIVALFGRVKQVLLQICLTQLIPVVVGDVTPDATQNHKTSAWLEAWRAAVGEREELQLAIRLTETAIRYRQTLDERILLELPIEERTALEQRLEEIDMFKTAQSQPVQPDN